MWNNRFLPYEIVELELQRPLEAISVPGNASGLAFVLRLDDRPVGFFMHPAGAGTTITSEELAEEILRHSGKHILSEKIFRELGRSPRPFSFPSLDIAICTHGRPEALERCLQSLRAIGAPAERIRVIVIDNAPKDDKTATLAMAFPGIEYVLEEKPGLDFARNRALRESTGEFLAFLDDDVVVDRAWLDGFREAWRVNPDAGGFCGPILPLELQTRAQLVFEQMGGFGKNFERVRFGRELPESPTYPVGAGVFGAGANMIFRRAALVALGGFDDALDTGAPLPGGGDLDAFYRLVRAGYPLVREPWLMVYHQHRREYSGLRRQMWTWGLGTMAFVTKTFREDPQERTKVRRWILWWLSYQLSKIFVPRLRRNRLKWPWDIVLAELLGAVAGICGEYDRSKVRIERIRRRFA
jgi:GT2 family glycosyltransferase